jgi:hypothetical protein
MYEEEEGEDNLSDIINNKVLLLQTCMRRRREGEDDLSDIINNKVLLLQTCMRRRRRERTTSLI